MLPSLSLLERIQQTIQNIPNKQGEYKRKIHYGCYLLCQEAGLRVSEAVNFDLSAKTKKGLYRIKKPKGKKERYVYIPKEVISELKNCGWKPNTTNRFNFYHFLKRIKKELGISKDIELTPHTLRRAFATYHAENGLPLPLLQKLLGHKSIKTTSLYWMNIYNEDDDDGAADILTAKNWPIKPESEIPVNLNLDESPKLSAPNLLASETPPNYLTKIKQLESQLSQIQREKNEKINELTAEKETLQNDLKDLSEQNAALCQNLTTKDKIINQLTQELTNEQEQRRTTENNLAQEKQNNNHLCQQLQAEQGINANLTQKLNNQEQKHTNLQNAYRTILKDKQKSTKLAQKEKSRANYYEAQLKSLAKTLPQWQKLNSYQQLEKQNEFQAQIIQRNPPPIKI